MFDLKSFLAAFPVFVIFLAFPFGNAFANNCTLPCTYPIPPNCVENDDRASFQNFPSHPDIFQGEVCHPNRNFNFYVTTGLFGSTVSNYVFQTISGAFNGTFVSGHPYYKIEFVGGNDPNVVSSSVGFVDIQFINNQGADVVPYVYVEVFDDGDNIIYSGVESPEVSIAPNAMFPLSFMVLTDGSEISYINVETIGKHGLLSVKYSWVKF